MKNTHDGDGAATFDPKVDHMPFYRPSTIARADVITGFAKAGPRCQGREGVGEQVQIVIGLRLAPGLQRVAPDGLEIFAGRLREPVVSHATGASPA